MTFDPEGIVDPSGLNTCAPRVFDIWHPFRMLTVPFTSIRWCRRVAPQPPANIFQAFSLIWPLRPSDTEGKDTEGKLA